MITGGIGLGLGPLATVPINYMLPPGNIEPQVEKLLFPFGRPDEIQDQFLPGWVRKIQSIFSDDPQKENYMKTQ